MRDYCYLEVGGEVVFCLRIISKIAVLSEGALAPPGACAPHRWPGGTPLLGTLQAAEGSSPLCQEGGTNRPPESPSPTVRASLSNLCEMSCS